MLTLFFVSTGIGFAFIGSVVGALVLGQLSGLPTDEGATLFPSHPYLQIYGFIAQFVMGVDYSLLPRFKVGKLPGAFFGYSTYALTTAANVFFLLSSLLVAARFPLDEVGAGLMLAGAMIFLSQVLSLVARPTGGFPEANPLIVLSGASLVLISTILVLGSVEPTVIRDVFSPQLIFLALLGFAGSMIYAVEIRSVSFRQCNYRSSAANVCSVSQCLGIVVLFVGVIAGSSLVSVLGAVLLLAAAFSQLISIKILELAHPLMYRPAMTEMHYRIMRYNEVCILLAAFWLVFGTAMGIAWLGFGYNGFFVRDSFIHALALGFVGSTITCFAPMLLPGLLGHRGPATGLTFGPIIALNLGVSVRILGNLETLVVPSPPVWEALSGPLVLLAMAWFLVMVRGIGKPARAPRKRLPEEFGLEKSEKIAQAKLTVTTRKTAREVSFPVWFAVQDDSIYLVPVNGTATSWYRNVLRTPTVRIEVAGHSYSGPALPIRDASQVRHAMGLFRDKYGERNCQNFFADRANVALRISTR